MQEFPELLRLERTAAGLQVEELHSRAVSAFTNKSSELERRLQEEQKRADAAECELRGAQERCSLVESQLKSSNESLLELQSQLSKSDSNWRRELDAVQQLLQDQLLDPSVAHNGCTAIHAAMNHAKIDGTPDLEGGSAILICLLRDGRSVRSLLQNRGFGYRH